VNDETQLNLLLDGLLSESDEQLLLQRMEHDERLRAQYLNLVHLHADLSWSGGAELATPVPEHVSSTVLPQRRIQFRWLAATIAPVLLCWVGYSLWSHSATSACEIVSIQGAVTFRSAEAMPLVPQVQQALGGGRFILEGDSASLQLRLLDGTLLSLAGTAELSISEHAERPLFLQCGQLTAEVQTQHPHAPLLVETPTAVVEILGTVLTLATEGEETHVQVESGKVRVKRRVDGQTIDLPHQQFCTATLNTQDEFRPQSTPSGSQGWHHVFDMPPPSRWKGAWVPANADQPAHVRAVPCIVGQDRERQTPIMNWGFTARRTPEVSLGQLAERSQVVLRLKLEREQKLRVMLGVLLPDGKYGGNFDALLMAEETQPCVGKFAEIALPFERFKPINGRLPKLASEMKPYLLLVTSYENDVGLSVSQIDITSE